MAGILSIGRRRVELRFPVACRITLSLFSWFVFLACFIAPARAAGPLSLSTDNPRFFVDGNGRTARALFYWSMLRQGYWLSSFVSISGILRHAPAQYARSFLYTETDDNDLTYFIIYQLQILRRAIDVLGELLERKSREIRKVERLLRPSVGFNHRQIALLGHALRRSTARYTIESHQTSHDVVYQTARTDLQELADRGLLERRKVGRRFVFSPPPDLIQRLQQLES